jgi:choline dehydrogenase-like flavoprotein
MLEESVAVAPEYDVVVVGAGLAGSLVANELAGKGVQVLILEAGDVARDRRELVAKFATSSSKGPHAPYVGLVAPQPYYADPPHPIPPAEQFGRDYYVEDPAASPSDLFLSYSANLAGGSTWQWQGLWLRMVPNDFRLRSRYGRGLDWPISYDDLEFWYCRAEQALGVSGDHQAFDGLHGAYRREPFPMPPLAQSFADGRIAGAVDGQRFDGMELRVTPIPQAKNSRPYRGRPACDGRSSCVPLCPIDAKYEARVHLEWAQARGAELRARSVVTRLEVANGGGISRIHFRDWDKRDGSASGRIVVLAANGIEIPKLLLLSHAANSSDQVGRNLMDHPIKMSYALANRPVYPFRGPPTTSSIESLRDGDFRRLRGAFRTSLRNDGWAAATGAPRGSSLDPTSNRGTLLDLVGNRRLFGSRLVERLFDLTSRQVLLGSAVEMLPNPENRVTPHARLTDHLGIPRPAIRFRIDDYTVAAFEAANRLHAFLFQQIGVTEQHFTSALTSDGGSGHILGTTIMGSDRRRSVVDRDCRSHDHPNLFILGGSVFPTASSANPTATVAALALRAADTIHRELRQPVVIG